MIGKMFVVFAVLAPLSVFASPKPPAVSCWLDWDLRDKSGVTIKNDSAKPVHVVVGKDGVSSLRGFSLKASLRGGGAAGGPVAWHELSVSIKHGDHEAYRSDIATGHRHALILIAGDERAVALCDITQPPTKAEQE